MYLQACKVMGIVPVSAFLNSLVTSKVDLKHHGLGSKGAKAIAISMAVSIYQYRMKA